jgi:hypothetical protein
MGIGGFGIPEVKNKIKNLRSTYAQEMKKIQESKKSGAVDENIYESNRRVKLNSLAKRVDAYSVKVAARPSR